MAILYVATIIGLGFSFFGSVLNSRLLSKEHFGDWKYLQNYLMMVSYFVNFGIYNSGGRLIASTEDPERIATFKGYMLYKSLVGLVIMLVITLILGLFWHRILNNELFTLLLVIFPLFIVHPLMFYLESIFQAERKLISFSVYKTLPPFLYIVSLLLLQSFSAGSIYFNALLFYLTYFVVFAWFIFKDRLIFKRKSTELTELMEENRTFGRHLYYGSLFNVGSSYILPILIGYFNINKVEVGSYSLALSFIIPFAFLPAIVGTSYFKEFIKSEKIPGSAFKKVLLACFLLLAATTISIDFFIDLFLGPKFHEVGFLVKLGATGAIMQGLGDFVNKFLNAKGKSVYIKKVAMVVGTVQVVASLLLIKFFSSTGAMVAKNIGSLIYFSLLYFYYHKNYIRNKQEEKLPEMSLDQP